MIKQNLIDSHRYNDRAAHHLRLMQGNRMKKGSSDVTIKLSFHWHNVDNIHTIITLIWIQRISCQFISFLKIEKEKHYPCIRPVNFDLKVRVYSIPYPTFKSLASPPSRFWTAFPTVVGSSCWTLLLDTLLFLYNTIPLVSFFLSFFLLNYKRRIILLQ